MVNKMFPVIHKDQPESHDTMSASVFSKKEGANETAEMVHKSLFTPIHISRVDNAHKATRDQLDNKLRLITS